MEVVRPDPPAVRRFLRRLMLGYEWQHVWSATTPGFRPAMSAGTILGPTNASHAWFWGHVLMARSWNSPLRARFRAAAAASFETERRSGAGPGQVLSVTELCEVVTLQLAESSTLRGTTVRGEVVDQRANRGHVYFTLRDATSSFSCVRWASVVGEPLVNGRLYDVTGKVELWAARGQINLIVSRVREVDAGERHQALERLTERLRLEGVFDPDRKRPLPRWPSRIGVATSADGAVIHDIATVIGRRMPLAEVVMAPCPVQGVGASGGIAAAVQALARARVDVIVVARGGGSAEDLACFNEELVVRAIRSASEQAQIPVVSAVGHETDTTLCDHAADLRAPTPSVAGELIVPDAAVLRGNVLSLSVRSSQGVGRRIVYFSRAIHATDRRMHLAYRTVAERVRLRLATLDRAISASVPGRIEALAVRGNALEVRARTAINARLGHAGLRVTASDSALRILNPLRVLDRGYAIIEAPLRDGRDAGPVTRVTDLQFGDAIRLRLRDGVANATITGLAVTDADRDV